MEWPQPCGTKSTSPSRWTQNNVLCVCSAAGFCSFWCCLEMASSSQPWPFADENESTASSSLRNADACGGDSTYKHKLIIDILGIKLWWGGCVLTHSLRPNRSAFHALL